ncbi:MAG: transglycosylase SLT domain-containing protein [Gammaproteobacteria bacterium]|nr:transglycosylase SLT domain-containing protein [Gammaproteobacteria bacterium]
MIRKLLIISAIIVSGCTTLPPSDVSDICAIFTEKDDWYGAADDARDRWGSPIPVMMAIMYQESRFQAKAKPPRKKILWVIPGPRPSSSYGYTQALTETWAVYKRNAGNYGADRDDFGDSIDFIGWYNHQSYKKSGIKKDDPYHLYLAYHEGHGGFNRRSYKNKQWLKAVSKKVSRQSAGYTRQLNTCEEKLKDDGWFFGLF